MKKYILLLLVGFLFSCSEDGGRESETAEFLGRWKLTEVLIDPGDGTGTFQPVSGNNTLEFLRNGTISSNYSFCPFYSGTATQFSTAYSADDNTILMNDCFSEGMNIAYEIDGDNLILNYPCYEACAYKLE